jgi:hypothetical protein
MTRMGATVSVCISIWAAVFLTAVSYEARPKPHLAVTPAPAVPPVVIREPTFPDAVKSDREPIRPESENPPVSEPEPIRRLDPTPTPSPKARAKNLCEAHHGWKVVTGKSWHCEFSHS